MSYGRQILAVWLSLYCVLLLGCAPMSYPPGAKNQAPQLNYNTISTADGARLPLRQWLPKQQPQAVIIAVHGFNDYSKFFQQAAEYFRNHGVACYAYDQRGFGAAPKRGLWAGSQTYADDLQTLIALLKQRYPKQPLYLLGESMGGAVIIASMRQNPYAPVAGIILSAPALWARSTMPWYQSGLLWTLAHSLPWLTLTGSSVKVMPSDNIAMLRALGRDPWVIKGTRVETIYGLTDLMDEAYSSVDLLQQYHMLLLYGEKDQIIPKQPTSTFVKQLLAEHAANKTIAIYKNGYHMLLRDLQAANAWQDILTWIASSQSKLPSGADERARQWLSAN